MKKALLMGLCVLMFSGHVMAARTINSATVDGGASTTVSAGATITVSVNVLTDGNGANGRWRSTGWRIAGSSGVLSCVDHANYQSSSGDFTQDFDITAPALDGTYNLYLVAYRDNGCSQGASSEFVLPNSVVVSTGGLSCETFRDDFNSSSFANNDGSQNWSANWVEVDGDGLGPGVGNAQISGGNLNLDDRPNTGGQPSLARESNLASYDSATLTFDFATTSGVDNSDAVVLEVSSNGGGSYTTLETFTAINGASTGSRSYDITAQMSANTRIRFRVSNLYGGNNETFEVDNLQLEACSTSVSGPFAWFQLDALAGSWNGSAGEVVDQTGNITGAFAIGTGSGVDSTSAQVCNGVDVPTNSSNGAQYGIDTSIDIDSDLGETGTISFWYNSNASWTGGGNRMLVDASTTADNKYFFLALMNSGSLRFRFEDSTDADFQLDATSQAFGPGTWHHIAMTWDLPNDSMEVFVDGGSIGTNNGNTSGLFGSLGTIYLGDNRSTYHPSGTANSANGIIDEVRIYQYVQTSAQIDTDRLADINSTRDCPFTPVAEWQFDECAYTGVAGEVIDNQGTYHATPFFGVNTNTPGQLGNYFDETSNRHQARTVTTVPLPTTWTTSVWFRTPFVTTQRYHVIGAMQGGGDLMYLDRNQNFRWGVYTPSGGVSNGTFRFGTLSNGWHHLVLVGNDQGANGQTLLYIDGAFVETVNLQAQGNLQYIGTSFDGAGGGGAQGFGTALDEFMVFDEVLSASTISAIYSNQLAGNNFDGSARTPPSCGAAVDHYSISHSGTGITCAPETVTVTAHNADHSIYTVTSDTAITVTTNPVVDAITSSPLTMTAGNSSATFTITETSVTPSIDINVTDGTSTETSGSAETNPSSPDYDDPKLEFVDSLFQFVTDTNAPPATTIGTQIGGKPSSTAPNNQNLYLRAVRTDDTTGTAVCISALDPGTHAIDMGYQCIDTNNCSTNELSVTNNLTYNSGAATTIAHNDGATTANTLPVSLDFDATGYAPLSFLYNNVGQIALYADDYLVNGGTINGDASNSFVVRPFGLTLDFGDSGDADGDLYDMREDDWNNGGLDGSNNNVSYAANASGTAFTRAGQNFTAEITAVLWQGSDDADNNGVADTGANLYNNTVASLYGQEATGVSLSTNASTAFQASWSLQAPMGGDSGGFTASATAGGIGTSFSSGRGLATFNWDEVGIIDIQMTLTDYLGDNTYSSSYVTEEVGRFYPDHFVLSDRQLTNRSDLGCVSAFTYMGENFQVSYDLEARNVGGSTTQNYTTASGFAKLNLEAELNYGAVDLTGPTDLSARLNVGAPAISFVAGLANDITDTLDLGRLASGPDGPYALSVGIAPADDDGVLLDSYNLDVTGGGNDHGLIQSTLINYGRIAPANAHGSELVPLTIPLKAQFYDSLSGSFIGAAIDNCTPYDAPANINLAAATYTAPLSAADLALTGAGLLTTGLANFSMHDNASSTVGPGVTGDVIYTMTVPAYLQYDWDGDNVFTDDPTAKATFGIFEGNSKQIYYRQIYQ